MKRNQIEGDMAIYCINWISLIETEAQRSSIDRHGVLPFVVHQVAWMDDLMEAYINLCYKANTGERRHSHICGSPVDLDSYSPL